MNQDKKDNLEDNVEDENLEAKNIENEEVEEVEEVEEKDKIDIVYEYIREKSQNHKLSNAEDFLEEPFELDVEETIELIDDLKTKEEFGDIKVVERENKIFLFSENFISNNYANMMIMVEEKDLLKLVANTVREESKNYPRPTAFKLFSYAPFKITKEQLDEVIKQMENIEEYSDIKQVKTSNKKPYLYSEKFMTKQHAYSLAEWTEVGQANNP